MELHNETPTEHACAPARRNARLRMVAACVALSLVLLPGSALAVKHSAARKAGRGLAAMTTGFLEIPGNIVQESRATNMARGFTLGFAMGLGKVVVRTLVGVYEFVSSPFPVPAGFKPLIEPEFPWDYFEDPAPRR